MTAQNAETVGGSFRDPSGFVVKRDGVFFRIVQPAYAADYRHLEDSGLAAALQSSGLLVAHEEVRSSDFPGAFKILKPLQLPFVSYPYEWCFSQLKAAALATLEIQKAAIAHGMSLKDASAFNIQFVDGKATLIDTLSFEKLQERPWSAYGQFCRHFLAPLALMALCDARLGRLTAEHLDGIPLDLAASILGWRGRLKPWLLLHIFGHARSEKSQRGKAPAPQTTGKTSGKFGVESLKGLVASLESAVTALSWTPPKAVWADYYSCAVTGGNYVTHKKEVVAELCAASRPKVVWDLGANTGLFSRVAAAAGAQVYSFDSDPDCVEINYLENQRAGVRRVLPLILDLQNPSPALGWHHQERMSWLQRQGADLALMLGLVHHLAMGNNVPLPRIADFCADLAPNLIIEFVPKDDDNARKLLRVREDIFPGFTKEGFEREFSRRFDICRATPIQDSPRVIYWMKRR